jgi:hypothetical protein
MFDDALHRTSKVDIASSRYLYDFSIILYGFLTLLHAKTPQNSDATLNSLHHPYFMTISSKKGVVSHLLFVILM